MQRAAFSGPLLYLIKKTGDVITLHTVQLFASSPSRQAYNGSC